MLSGARGVSQEPSHSGWSVCYDVKSIGCARVTGEGELPLLSPFGQFAPGGRLMSVGYRRARLGWHGVLAIAWLIDRPKRFGQYLSPSAKTESDQNQY